MRWTKRVIVLALGIALGVVAIVFASHNRQPVQIDLYFGAPLTAPLWVLTGACLLIGATVALLLTVGAWFGRRRERRLMRRRVAELEREVLDLRNIPLDTLEPDQPPPAAERAVLVSTGRMPRQVHSTPPQAAAPRLLGEPRRPLLTSGSSEDDDDEPESRPHR